MDFVAKINHHNISMLDNIVKIAVTLVSDQMPQTKRQSKQWISKGLPGPCEGQVHASGIKVLTF
jgi:hypothetical protein